MAERGFESDCSSVEPAQLSNVHRISGMTDQCTCFFHPSWHDRMIEFGARVTGMTHLMQSPFIPSNRLLIQTSAQAVSYCVIPFPVWNPGRKKARKSYVRPRFLPILQVKFAVPPSTP
ncbi:hypothetical protein CLAIMM_04379 [Cladophialophora immunda]|nr:hypothetical protein CLAIMM_04379 [Cladophialophora immunda]